MTSDVIDCFVIGAMKAGTTAMCDWLGVQPDIAMSNPKEPAVFASDESVESWAGRLGTLHEGAAADAVRVEGSTDYAKFPAITGVPQRVAQHNPAARFVYMMRHPVDRTISQYRFQWLMGGDKLPFEQALAANPELIEYSRYAFQLTQWLEVFPHERFLLVFAEEFARDPKAELRRVLDFLGVTVEDVVTPSQTHSNQTDWLVRRTLVRRLLRDSALGQTVRPFVPDVMARIYRRRLEEKSRPDITDAHRAALARTFDDDLRELTRLTRGPGITCASWTETTATWTPRPQVP